MTDRYKLNETRSPIDPSSWSELNENWNLIKSYLRFLERQIKFLAGGNEIDDILLRIDTAIANAENATADVEQARKEFNSILNDLNALITNAETATENANTAASNANELNTALNSLKAELESLQTSLNNIVQAESQRASNEQNRVTAEQSRKSEETTRRENEAARVLKEQSRETAEQNRTTTFDKNMLTAEQKITMMQYLIDNLKSYNFDLSATYNFPNLIKWNGSTFIALKEVTGLTPVDDGINYRLVAQRGVDGTGAVSSVNGNGPDANGNVEVIMALVNNLVSDSTTAGLTAAQGKALKVLFDGLHQTLSSHVGATDNPHGVTAEQLALGKVQNFGVATQEEAEEGLAADKYMTAQRTKQAINKNLQPVAQSLSSHLEKEKSYQGKRFTINNPYEGSGALRLKGQLHSHTVNTDGTKTAVAVVTEYKNAGYDFISITDHDFLTPNPNVSGIVFIPGVEELSWGNHAHLLAYDTTDQQGVAVYPTHEAYRPAYQEVLDYHRFKGRITGIAHPDMGTLGMPVDEIIRNEGFTFIEMFNALGNVYSRKTIDTALSAGKRFFITASDDYHGNSPFNEGYVVMYAKEKTKESILEAFRNGRFYASTGNDLEISVVGDVISVSSTAASTFRFIGKDGKVFREVTNATSAQYKIVGYEQYVRVESIRHSDGKVAFSQPIQMDMVNAPKVIYCDKPKNLLVNSNFDVWQRGSSFFGVNTVYTADRWWISQNTSRFEFIRNVSNDAQSQFFARLHLAEKGVNFSDLAIIQSPENSLIKRMKGRTIAFSVELRKNAVFNAGVMRLTISTGTVAGERNAATGRKSKELIIRHDELSTSEWQRFTLVTSVEFDVESMMCVIRLSDLTGSTNHPPEGSIIDIRSTQLVINPEPVEYERPKFSDELQECMRFYEKSYPLETTIFNGKNTSEWTSTIISQPVPSDTIQSSQYYGTYPFKIKKFKRPTVIVHPYDEPSYVNIVSSGTGDSLGNLTGNPVSISDNAFSIRNDFPDGIAGTAGGRVLFHWEADAEMY